MGSFMRLNLKIFNAAFWLVLAAASAHASNDDWFMVASNDNATWYAKKGSARLGTLDRKIPSVHAAFKSETKRDNKIYVFRLVVKQSDCEREQGKLFENDMDGNFKDSYDFVIGAGSFGAAAAEALCDFYRENKKSSKKK